MDIAKIELGSVPQQRGRKFKNVDRVELALDRKAEQRARARSRSMARQAKRAMQHADVV